MSTIQNIITFDYAIAASPCAHYTSYYTWICRQHKSVPHYTSCYDNQISYIVPLPVVVFSAFHKFTLLRIISWSPLYSCCHLPALCCIIPPTRKCSWGSARTSRMTHFVLLYSYVPSSTVFSATAYTNFCHAKQSTYKELHLSGRYLSGSPIILIGLAIWIHFSRILKKYFALKLSVIGSSTVQCYGL